MKDFDNFIKKYGHEFETSEELVELSEDYSEEEIDKISKEINDIKDSAMKKIDEEKKRYFIDKKIQEAVEYQKKAFFEEHGMMPSGKDIRRYQRSLKRELEKKYRNFEEVDLNS